MRSVGPPDANSPAEDFANIDEPGLDLNLLRRRRERVLAILAVALVLSAAVGISLYVLRPAPVARADLVGAAHRAIQQAIGSGPVYQFSDSSETRIERVAGGDYEVSAEVLAIMPAGQSRKYAFTCTLVRRTDGSWAPAKLQLVPL